MTSRSTRPSRRISTRGSTAEMNSTVTTRLSRYEWSGNTTVAEDHNVFFRHEGREIHRSSHALLTDRSDINSTHRDLKALYAALKDEDSSSTPTSVVDAPTSLTRTIRASRHRWKFIPTGHIRVAVDRRFASVIAPASCATVMATRSPGRRAIQDIGTRGLQRLDVLPGRGADVDGIFDAMRRHGTLRHHGNPLAPRRTSAT